MTALSEERERELIKLTSELIERVREVDPERNHAWLLAHQSDWRDMLIVLAAQVDPSKPLSVRIGWTRTLVRDDD